MATAHTIRDLIAQTTAGTARHHVPRGVRDEVYRYAGRRRSEGAATVREQEEVARERVGLQLGDDQRVVPPMQHRRGLSGATVVGMESHLGVLV